jgi:CRP-like cAMP-binding protein
MEHLEIQKALEGSELFRGIEESHIRKIAALCSMDVYSQGQCVFRQGDLGDRICIIAEGQVFLERAVDLGTRKGSVLISTLGRGRVFGCWSTLLNEAHTLMSSASCRKPAKIVSLKGATLRAMMESNTLLGFHIMERLCHLLRDRMQSTYGAMEKI